MPQLRDAYLGDVTHARNAYTASGVSVGATRHAENLHDTDEAIHSGKRVTTEDGLLITASDLVDAVVEVTGIPEVGARMAYSALTNNKHLVMVNVETDVTVGPILKHLADSAGVVYTPVDGDQPSVTMNMIESARTLGFEIVAAGRGTTFFGDDRTGTPDTVPERFGSRRR